MMEYIVDVFNTLPLSQTGQQTSVWCAQSVSTAATHMNRG